MIAADGRRACFRPSITRPAKSVGAISGKAAGRSGLLSTAGNVLFAGDASTNLVALHTETGQALWHANLGAPVTNGPMTYELDGTQYLVVAAGDMLFGFAMLSAK